jgi:hypothetical protein
MRAGWCLKGGLACAFSLAFVFAFAHPAHAYERQQHLGVSAGGMAFSPNGGGTTLGGNLGLHYNYGLSDAFTLVLEADASAFPLGTAPKTPPPQPSIVTTGGVGLVYVFDVLRWVPYAGGLVGAGYFTGGYLPKGVGALDLELAAGLDYQITRTWTVGAAYRQHFFVTQTNTFGETISLRFQYVWGW